ncbi:SDH family Clp fold serine proteinase [Methanoregula sp.]|uniref:SDH family Clp fold serine proteinase n=1 Tax=Methanoregula sp. TaxID=2052170 RepID=UPI002C76A067|nr:hypothetical protein [Methanoregula sp.]HVP96396.1 hypothetical protein [Methanoregula sp.]
MTSWNDVLTEIKEAGSTHDVIRRKYLKKLHEVTQRNIIVYYSGWLQKPGINRVSIEDEDKNGFMASIKGLDRSIGLDLILHTPGGSISATESIVEYLHDMFDEDIRVIVPQLAMSAGTMIACASKCIIMGKQSSLGPIDPQYKGLPAHGIIEEFNRAYIECKKDQDKIPVWQPIIARYHPTLIGECEKSITWSNSLVRTWLKQYMFNQDGNADAKVKKIINYLASHSKTKAHDRHFSAATCLELGLNIEMMECDQRLQDAILAVHHSYIHTLSSTDAFKIIENHNGVAFVQSAKIVAIKPS